MGVGRLADAAWIALCCAYILAGVALVPFHGDESAHLFMTRDTHYQFIAGDLSRIRYAETPVDALAITEQEFRLLNGTVYKYWAGAWWHLRGFTVDDLNRVWWTWGADWNYNEGNGAIPSEALLLTARLASAALMGLGAVALFGIAWTIAEATHPRLAAYSATALYALSPALLVNGRRAMLEGALLLFSLLAVLAALHFARALARPRPDARPTRAILGWALLLGLATGMTVASKHTGLFTVLPLYIGAGGLIVWRALRRHDSPGRAARHLLALGAGGALSIAVFLALNPAWWADPVGVIRPVLALRERLLAEQTAAFGAYPDALAGLAGYARQVWVGLPQYYEAPDWAAFLGGQIAAYEGAPWAGVALGASPVGLVALLALAVAGGWQLWRGPFAPGVRPILVAWIAGTTALTVALTPLEWARYYLPAVPPLIALWGLGAAALWRALSAARAARWPVGSAPSAG